MKAAATLIVTTLLAACATPGAVECGSWQADAPMLHARAAHAVVADASGIYALAGTGANGQPVLAVEAFREGRWTVETSLPGHGLNASAAALVGSRIYLIGGFNTTTNVPTADVKVYDLRTRQWSDAPPLPRPRGGHAAAVLDGRIHVIGGGNSQSTLADHSVFDPSTLTWTERAPLPRPMGSPAAAVHEGALHTVGGRSGRSDFGDVLRYDATADRWVPLPAIPPRGTAGAVSYCGSLLVFGGESQARAVSLDEVLRFDAARGEWRPMPPMPTARNFARAVLHGGAVVVVGGSRSAGSSHASAGSTVVERFSARCG